MAASFFEIVQSVRTPLIKTTKNRQSIKNKGKDEGSILENEERVMNVSFDYRKFSFLLKCEHIFCKMKETLIEQEETSGMERIGEKLERMNRTIHTAMELSEPVRFHYFQYHQLLVITGLVESYDPYQQQIRIVDEDGQLHRLEVKQIFDVERMKGK